VTLVSRPAVLVRHWRRYWVEAAIAAMAVITTTEALASSWGRKHALLPVLSLFFVAPLLLRRRFPLPSIFAVYASLALAAGLYPTALQNINSPFFAVVLATVIVGATPERRVAYFGAAITFALVSIIYYRDPSASPSDFFFLLFFFGAAWLAGLALASRSQQTDELRARIERAERDREAESQRAVEEERARIARELHDVVAHSVSVMVVQAGGVRRLLDPDQDRQREALLAIEHTGRAALTEMRRMLGVLRSDELQPGPLTPQPGLEYLDRLLEQMREAGLPVELEVEGDPVPLTAGVDLSAYRIVQEGLTNTLKHAGPGATARVVVRYLPEQLELEVSNDGQAPANGDGHGLVGMRERVALYGGTLEAGPGKNGGYSVRARLPVEGVSS
jgi:signal transduction histidine kinase